MATKSENILDKGVEKERVNRRRLSSCREKTLHVQYVRGTEERLTDMGLAEKILFRISFHFCVYNIVLVDCLVVPGRYTRCCKHNGTAEGTMAPANSGLGPKSQHNCNNLCMYV